MVHRRVGITARQPEYDYLRRTHGLDSFRKAWWSQSKLESYRCLRRYALLLDWAMGEAAKKTIDRRPQTGDYSESLRILVFRMGHLGDVLHLMPTIREMRRQRPGWRIELVTGPWNKVLLESYKEFDAVHYWTPDVVQFHRGNRADTFTTREEKAFSRELRGSGVDVVMCPSIPHFAELSLIVCLHPLDYVGGEWPLSGMSVPFYCDTLPHNSRHYEMDAVADFLPRLGLIREPVELDYTPRSASRTRVDAWLHEVNAGVRTLIVIFPGSGWPGKCWPADRFARLAELLAARHDSLIVLAGSPGERMLCNTVASHMHNPVVNAAGLFSIDESAALIGRAALVIGNDSAPVHLAAAMKVPTVSLWGPTLPEKWAPKGDGHVTVKRQGDCKGCTYWHPAAVCTGTPSCMTTIDVDDVLDAVQRQPSSQPGMVDLLL